MLKDNITPKQVVDLLNEMLKIDEKAIVDFVKRKTYCNKKLAFHPTLQVDSYSEKGKYKVGMIGFLNSLFGKNKHGFGCICYIIEKDGRISGFKYDKDLK